MTTFNSWAAATVLASLAILAAPAQASDSLVANGGFETGDFTGWTGTGETLFNGVQCGGPGPAVYAGNCSAYFGAFDTQGGIEQVIDLGSASTWTLSFALATDGGSPSSVAVQFGGQTLLALSNPTAAAYKVYTFSGLTTSANETLSFSFLDPTGFISLDNVALAVPEPATTSLLGLGLAALCLARRRARAGTD